MKTRRLVFITSVLSCGLALAAETVSVEPKLGPIGPNHDAEALAVGDRVFLVRRRRIADFRIAQFNHGKAPSQSRPASVPSSFSVPTAYPNTPDALGQSRTVPGINIWRNA